MSEYNSDYDMQEAIEAEDRAYKMRHFIKLEMDASPVMANDGDESGAAGTLKHAAVREEDSSQPITPTPYDNGDLPEDIYPEQPPYISPSTPAICKEVVYEDEDEYSDDQDQVLQEQKQKVTFVEKMVVDSNAQAMELLKLDKYEQAKRLL